MVGISGRALSKITSSFMVFTSDNQKTNLGLSLKFEAKALKVIDYSRKEGRTWEYSQKAVDLIKEYKVSTARFMIVYSNFKFHHRRISSLTSSVFLTKAEMVSFSLLVEPAIQQSDIICCSYVESIRSLWRS